MGPEAFAQLEDDIAWRRTIAKRMDTFEKQLAENTLQTCAVRKDTRELVETFQNFKGAMKVLEMFGKLARPLGWLVVAVGGGAAAWFHLGPPK